jgi:hypothetical protein
MRRVNRYLLLLALCATATAVYAWEPVDRIVAVVGDRVIAGSELDFQLQLYQVQTGAKVNDATEVRKLKEQILAQMIDDRLILIKATQDTTIRVSEDEVDEALNNRMDELKSRFPSQEQFETGRVGRIHDARAEGQVARRSPRAVAQTEIDRQAVRQSLCRQERG